VEHDHVIALRLVDAVLYNRMCHSNVAVVSNILAFVALFSFLILPPNLRLHSREFTQHDAPADDEPKKSRNERGHAILSQALARI